MTSMPRHSVAVAGVTVREDGRILVVQRRDNGRWEAPGGVLEQDETFEQGVVREIAEETGVTVAVDHLSGVYKNMTIGVVAIVYRCHFLSGEPTTTAESQRVEWLTVDEVEDRMMPAYAVRVLDALTTEPCSRAHDGTIVHPS
ncbi:NUDIX hydrolase [Pseudonocardia sp. HH130629-09]|uniref:NUDIX hydrolase n=1 Tax=Pseudonocardia sp. HH130629-09 TaxID=1641402 RepID=UPI0006CB3C8C|nr:NUDIX domain-containing protein [Pseudonocardia sp. HH130629-09]ALE86293.1 NUDIX hydrolase [Pseudonocardia sp. HH130629-09]